MIGKENEYPDNVEVTFKWIDFALDYKTSRIIYMYYFTHKNHKYN